MTLRLPFFGLLAFVCTIASLPMPAQTGCIAPSACNYDPAALNGSFNQCDWSCYGCTDLTACNYDPSATLLIDLSAEVAIDDDLETLFGYSFQEANAAYLSLDLAPCVFPNPDFGGDCACSMHYANNAGQSPAYISGLLADSGVLHPFRCGDYAYAGHSGTLESVEVTFPCDVANGLYYSSFGNGTEVTIHIPETMTQFTIDVVLSESELYTIHYNPAFTNVVVVNDPTFPGVGNTFGYQATTEDLCFPTCHAPSACNYDPSGQLTNPSVCSWSCYGCTSAAACNYDPEAQLAYALTDLVEIRDELQDVYDMSYLEAVTFAGQLGLVECFFSEPALNNDCDCSSYYTSTAYQQSGAYGNDLDGGEVDLFPAVCSNIAFATGRQDGTYNVTYPCDVASGVFFVHEGTSITPFFNTVIANLVVPETMTAFHISCESGWPVVNVTYNPAFTTVTQTQPDSGTLTVNLNEVEDITCTQGCLQPEACNYNPIAVISDNSCLLPDGCTDATACNYDALAQCDNGTCLYAPGCQDPLAVNYNQRCTPGCLYPNACGGLSNTDANLSQGFEGPFAPGQWTISDGCPAACSFSGNPEFLELNNPVFGEPLSATLTVPVTGYYQFGWSLVTDLANPDFPPSAFVLVDGLWEALTTDGFEGTALVYLEAGTDFGFSLVPGTVLDAEGDRLIIGSFVHPGVAACTPGCTYPSATNYAPSASTDDGSCDFSASPCAADLDNNNEISSGDLLVVLGLFGTTCAP